MGDTIRRRRAFGYGAITLCGPAFNPVRLTRRFITPAGPARTRTHAPSTPRAQRLAPVTRARFGLIRFRSPLLTEHPFLQVLRCFTSLRTPRANAVPAHDGRRVPPFGDPRIKAMLEAPLGLSHPQTSFIGTVCQGIHHTPLQATHTTKVHGRKIPLANSQTTNHHTKNDHKTIETNNRVRFEINSKTKIQKLLFCSRPLSSSQTTTHPHASPPTPPGDGRPARGTEHQPRQTARGGGPGTQKHARTTPGRTARPARPKADSTLPHQQPPRTRHIRGKGAHTGHRTVA